MSTIAGSNVWHLKGKHVEDFVNQDDTVPEADGRYQSGHGSYTLLFPPHFALLAEVAS